MRRSEINAILRDAAAFIRGFGVHLPPFADWTPDTLRACRPAEILARGLGWDVTDYNQGRFAEIGLALFTLRNGRLADLRAGGGMCYAEKLLISREGQVAPMHRHVVKAEDIINRGGATLAIELFASAPDGAIDPDAEVAVTTDGLARRLPAGGILRLAPGESVTLMPGDWHAFWGEGGDVLIGEVSTVNDDLTDNVFAAPLGRFPVVEEDEAPFRLLVSDYPGLAA
jgi:D-lyxose ketol-isomerase